jgi:hypothetical protein
VVIENLLQPNLSAYFNMMYDKTRFDGAETLVSMLGDDMVFLTEGYDLAILKEINAYEGKGFVWCNDDYIARERLCVNLFTTRLMVEGTERPFMCPLFNADLIDDVWMEVGLMTGCGHFLPDAHIRHEHSTAQAQVNWDGTFQRLRPLQQIVSTKWHRKQAHIWSTLCAAALVKNGLCEWRREYKLN